MLVAAAAAVLALLAVGFVGADIPGVARFMDGLVSLAPGSTADAALSQRFDFWAGASALSAIYPLGTFGPPEMLLGTAIDNDWIRLFLQASIAGFASVGIMLIGGAIWADRSRLCGRALTASSVVVAVCALTHTPLTYPPIALYWLVVGLCIVAPPVPEEATHG